MKNFVAMMSNGTSGDINNIPFGVTRPPREPFEQIRIVAAEGRRHGVVRASEDRASIAPTCASAWSSARSR